MMHICIILWTLHYTTASVLHYGLCITLRFLCYITIATLHYNSDTTLWSPHYTTEMCVTTTIVIGIVARDDAREFSTSCGNFTPKRVSFPLPKVVGLRVGVVRSELIPMVCVAE